VEALAQQENTNNNLKEIDWKISQLINNMTKYWEKIDMDWSVVWRKIWKENTKKVLLIHQVTMLMGELGEIIRGCYTEPTSTGRRIIHMNTDDGKDASNVMLHAIQIIRLLEGDNGVNNAITRALEEMSQLSKEYADQYGVKL
jgi:hypothetical protein